MLKREARGGIVVTSSIAGMYPFPGLLGYSSAKVFAKFFAEALHYEVKEKIDVLAW